MPDRIEKAIAEKGIYASKTTGDSMNPMLVQGRDTVFIKKAEFPLKKYDIPVYHRDDHYTMHRIVKVTKKGYVICGDNRVRLERDITEKEIVGVLAAFYHNGKYVEYGDAEYMRYAKRACRTYPLRVLKRIIFKLKERLRKK
ncbi:MAG: S24/S26 family peptidase [Clostridia bacterium]|nr:S24/S26 family peptidase [Clostridia bacterium]